MEELQEVNSETKRCPKCKLVKNKSEFHKNKNRYDGVVVYCKECTSKYHKEFRRNNKEKTLKWSRDYYKNNKQQHRQTCKAWMNKNKEKMREYEKQWVRDNREKVLAKGLKYYYAHHSKCIKAAMNYKKLHPEKSRQYVHKRNAIKQQTATEEIILQDIFERDNWI